MARTDVSITPVKGIYLIDYNEPCQMWIFRSDDNKVVVITDDPFSDPTIKTYTLQQYLGLIHDAELIDKVKGLFPNTFKERK